jgi:hypothetical protein
LLDASGQQVDRVAEDPMTAKIRKVAQEGEEK